MLFKLKSDMFHSITKLRILISPVQLHCIIRSIITEQESKTKLLKKGEVRKKEHISALTPIISAELRKKKRERSIKKKKVEIL